MSWMRSENVESKNKILQMLLPPPRETDGEEEKVENLEEIRKESLLFYCSDHDNPLKVFIC